MNAIPASPESENEDSLSVDTIAKALVLFELTPPFSSTTLYERYQDLLLTWHPHRYANMTNNPSKYMKMYKKGEAMTKEVRSAYQALKEWMEHQAASPSE